MEKIFRSKIVYDLLAFFVDNSRKKFYLSQISKSINHDLANTARELLKLEKENLIKHVQEDKRKYYFFNNDMNVSRELASLFLKIKSQNLDEKFRTKWLLAEELPNTCPYFAQIFLNCFVNEFTTPNGKAYKKVAAIIKGYHLWYYFDEKDAFDIGESIAEEFISNPSSMSQVNKKIIEHSDLLRKFANELPENNLAKLTNKRLWDFYKKHNDIHTAYYKWGWLPVAVDMFHSNLTEKGRQILIAKGIKEDKVGAILNVLTQPSKPSLLKNEEDELIQIGIKVQNNQKQLKIFQELFKNFKEVDVKLFGLYTHSPEYERKLEEKVMELEDKIDKKIMYQLQNHYMKYFYTKFLFTEEQGVYSFEHYLKNLVRLVNNNTRLEKVVDEQKNKLKKESEAKDRLIKKLKLNHDEIIFFNEWGEFMITKIYRRFAQIFALYKMTPVLEEIGIRFNLSLKQTRFMTLGEVEQGLLVGKVDIENIKRRTESAVFYAEKNNNFFVENNRLDEVLKFLETDELDKTQEIRGQCAQQGFAKGKVKIVNLISEIGKIEPGDILVSLMTQPDLIPAMKKAAAFVTDQGGVTSHAAIVAREMGKPCVIGTKIATKVLKDGDCVEVDANRGIVKII